MTFKISSKALSRAPHWCCAGRHSRPNESDRRTDRRAPLHWALARAGHRAQCGRSQSRLLRRHRRGSWLGSRTSGLSAPVFPLGGLRLWRGPVADGGRVIGAGMVPTVAFLATPSSTGSLVMRGFSQRAITIRRSLPSTPRTRSL
jgi:hypothetical protein